MQQIQNVIEKVTKLFHKKIIMKTRYKIFNKSGISKEISLGTFIITKSH